MAVWSRLGSSGLAGVVLAGTLACTRLSPQTGQRSGVPDQRSGVAASAKADKRQAHPTSPPPASSAKAEAPPIRPSSASSAQTNIDLQGYVGKHPIRAVLGVVGGAEFDGHVGDAWEGAYRYMGKQSELKLVGGRITTSESGEPIEPDWTDSGGPSERFECQLEEAFAGRVTGTFRGWCNTSDNQLFISGTWHGSTNGRELPFFLGPIGAASEFDTYHRAILKTPGPAHACGAYARVGYSVSLPDGHSLVNYVLKWPCEEEATGRSTALAFLGKADRNSPDRFLAAPLLLGSIDSNAEMDVSSLDGGTGNTRLYLVTLAAISSAGSDAVRCCWSSGEIRYFLLPVTRDGKLGRPVELAKTQVASGLGSCLNRQATYQFAELELDGKPGPEVVATLQEEAEIVQPAPPGVDTIGGAICVPAPPTIVHRVFRIDSRVPRLMPLRVDTRELNRALSKARILK